MRRSDFELLKERISVRYDPDEIVEILALTSIDILDAFEDNVYANLTLFDDCLDDFEEIDE